MVDWRLPTSIDSVSHDKDEVFGQCQYEHYEANIGQIVDHYRQNGYKGYQGFLCIIATSVPLMYLILL